jgi:ribosomal protein S25
MGVRKARRKERVEAEKEIKRLAKVTPPEILRKIEKDIEGMSREEMIKYFEELSR